METTTDSRMLLLEPEATIFLILMTFIGVTWGLIANLGTSAATAASQILDCYSCYGLLRTNFINTAPTRSVTDRPHRTRESLPSIPQ